MHTTPAILDASSPDPVLETRDLRRDDELLAELARRGHEVRRRYGYRGSLQSVDLAHEAWARTAARAGTLRDEDPGRFLDHALRQVRFVLFDRFRRAGHKAPDERLRSTLDEDSAAAPADPELADRVRWLDHELVLLADGEVRAPFRDPAPKVRAFQLRRDGWTDAAIAAELGVAKPTVNLWIQAVSAHLVVRARRGGWTP